MNKKQLYEKIMKSVAKTVKKALEEDYVINGHHIDSLQQQTMDQLDDVNKPVQFKDQQIVKTVQDIYQKLFTNFKFMSFMKQNKMEPNIEWSYKTKTACTDGFKGRLVINPEFITKIYNICGEQGVQFIILHETMHNYYNNVRHAQEVNSVQANVMVDERINREIVQKWPEFKDIPRQIGAII